MSESETPVIYVGKKPTINYVLVTVTALNQSNKCVIQARGRQISKAVDIAEITRRKFMLNNIDVEEVKIGSEELQNEEQEKTRIVSTIEITLVKK